MELVYFNRIGDSPDDLFVGTETTIDGVKVEILEVGNSYTLGDPDDAAINLRYRKISQSSNHISEESDDDEDPYAGWNN